MTLPPFHFLPNNSCFGSGLTPWTAAMLGWFREASLYPSAPLPSSSPSPLDSCCWRSSSGSAPPH